MAEATTAAQAIAAALRPRVAQDGEHQTCDFLTVSRATFARLYGGLPVKWPTTFLAASKLGIDLAGLVGAPEPVGEDEPEAIGS